MSSQSAAQTTIGPVGRFGLAALAVWRVTHLIALEDGPFNVITRMRHRLGDGFFGQLTDCFACTSVWVAAPVAAALRPRRGGDLVLSWLALSGAACLLQQWSADGRPELRYTDDEESQSDGML
jgi:hypothetical protein